MHVHIDGKENEKILSSIKIKTCWHLKLNEMPPRLSGYTQIRDQ